MFNHHELRQDLLHTLVWMTEGTKQAKPKGPESPTGKAPEKSKQFDVVIEYNRSMERWYKEENPPSSKISHMCDFIADFLEWYSKNISNIMGSSPFFRDSLDHSTFKQLGLDKKYHAGRLTCISSDRRHTNTSFQDYPKSDSMYFFNRWLWVQFPWMCLEKASQVWDRPKAVPRIELERPKDHRYSLCKTNRKDDDNVSRLSLRTKATVRASVPSASLSKADSIGTNSSAKEREKSRNTDYLNQAYTHLLELREIYDNLVVEAAEKDRCLVELCDNIENSIVGHGRSRKGILTKKSMLEKLQTRLEQIQDLVSKATEVENVYSQIFSFSQLHNPSDKKLHLELEQLCVLSKSQISDLLKGDDDLSKEIGSIEAKMKEIGKNLTNIALERRELKLSLNSLLARKNDTLERQKALRRATPDEDIYSKYYTAEKPVPQTAHIQITQFEKSTHRTRVNEPNAVEIHPLKKIADAVGTTNPDAIVEKIKQDETLEEELRISQLKLELCINDRKSKLHSIENKIKDFQLFDQESVSSQPAESADNEISKLKSRFLSIQKQVSSLSKLNEGIIFSLKNIIHDRETYSTTSGFTPCHSDESDLSSHEVVICTNAIKQIFKEFV
ncbi:hypothetical protein ACHAXS_011643 [Conticribra weissflogii]